MSDAKNKERIDDPENLEEDEAWILDGEKADPRIALPRGGKAPGWYSVPLKTVLEWCKKRRPDLISGVDS